MKINWLIKITCMFWGALPVTVLADITLADMASRIKALEILTAEAIQRAESAENRANKLAQMMTLQATTPSSQPKEALKTDTTKPTIKFNQQNGELKIDGNIELNIDGSSRKGQMTSIREAVSKSANSGKNDNWDINGRILLGFQGKHQLANGNETGFQVEPLAKADGDIGLDDAFFYFGKHHDWTIKVGRYEGYSMFPLDQDIFISHSGNTSNSLYTDGYGYVYMMKEGRGRSNDGGSIQLSKRLDNWYFEVNTLVEDGTALFGDERYHGYDLDNRKSAVYLRPVAVWKPKPLKIALAMESQVMHNAYGATIDGKWKDFSRRNGYGLNITWDTTSKDKMSGIKAAFNTAYMEANAETDFSAGGYAKWRRFVLGYIYAHNNIKDFNPNKYQYVLDDESVLNGVPGKYDLHTLYVSYEIPNILHIENYNIYLGAYYSTIATAKSELIDKSDDERYGFRIRFKYLF
ncbi:carbohydrate porin [Providencia sp. PROV152]|uniref:Carbohydrate porin n=1 Tax=Providencia stuartii TaxID=588 RepID=A0AAI9HYU6_PROST|nr:carbohydrate porin [Providencia sp. PROV152]ELR5035085.1 carbohydrate porin [Providencia stuartii]